MNISAKTNICLKIFWDVDMGPRYYQFILKTRAPKSHASVPLIGLFKRNELFFTMEKEKHGMENYMKYKYMEEHVLRGREKNRERKCEVMNRKREI